MSDLTEWLLACIAEDEAVAREASEVALSGEWHVVPVYGVPEVNVHTHKGDLVAHAMEYAARQPPVGEYIARQDPAHVLATCKAHREIVEWHKSWPVLVESEPVFERADLSDVNSMTYRMSKQIAWTTEQKYREHFGTEPPTGPILRIMAAVYADHPGYREEWRP